MRLQTTEKPLDNDPQQQEMVVAGKVPTAEPQQTISSMTTVRPQASLTSCGAVSYTHLDVYKRQRKHRTHTILNACGI